MALNRRIGREIGWIVVTAVLGLGALFCAEVVLGQLRGMGSPVRHLDNLLRGWIKQGPAACTGLGLLAAALASAARAALVLRRHDDPEGAVARELRILAASGAISTAAFLAAVVWSVHARRDGAAPDDVFFSASRTEHEVVMWSITGAGLVLLAALWSVVGVVWARRGSAGSAARIVTILGLASVVSVTAASLLRWWAVIPSISSDTEWLDPARRYELILGTGEPLVQGRSALIVAAAIAAFAIVIVARRERPRPAVPIEIIAAAVLFALGLGAFALTRGAAHDALHPLPYWDGSAAGWIDDDAVATLPVGERCALGARDQPLLRLSSNGRVNFRTAGWQDVVELQKSLESLKALWQQVQPGKQFPGRLEVAIPASTPITAVTPAVVAARAAGYADLDVIEAMPRRTYVTRTLGEMVYRPRVCHVPIRADVELPRQGTWGDFARSLPAP